MTSRERDSGARRRSATTRRQWLFPLVRAALIALPLVLLLALTLVVPGSASAGGVEIRVEKALRRLTVLEDGVAVRTYEIALGANPIGHKQEEGDERTPEGRYVIDYRNTHSRFHRSLHISYPNEKDRREAEARGVSAGGDIVIHGLPPGWSWLGAAHHAFDWTDGCIAVTNDEMDELWERIEEGTPIEILP